MDPVLDPDAESRPLSETAELPSLYYCLASLRLARQPHEKLALRFDPFARLGRPSLEDQADLYRGRRPKGCESGREGVDASKQKRHSQLRELGSLQNRSPGYLTPHPIHMTKPRTETHRRARRWRNHI